MSNHVRKTGTIAALLVMASINGYAFVYTVMLRDKTFNKQKYHFAIEKFIDKRANKQKEIGFVPGFFYDPQSVGNDSLEQQMNAFLKINAKFFDTTQKVMVELTKLTLEQFDGYALSTGKVQDIEISMLLNYYKTNKGEPELIYEESVKRRMSVKFIMSRDKAVDVAFSEVIKYAFSGFDRYLNLTK